MATRTRDTVDKVKEEARSRWDKLTDEDFDSIKTNVVELATRLQARYGLTAEWLSQIGKMVSDYGQAGMVFNSWNGYTEGMVAVPGITYQSENFGNLFFGNLFYDWLQSLKYDVYAPPYTLGPYILN